MTPEVSSLDFAIGLVFQGFNIPALSTRRVQTEIELEDGQSFVIGGLLDNRLTETLSKVPGLANIPLLGKLFQSRSDQKQYGAAGPGNTRTRPSDSARTRYPRRKDAQGLPGRFCIKGAADSRHGYYRTGSGNAFGRDDSC